MAKFYGSQEKLFRAQSAVADPGKFAKDHGEQCAELVLVKRGIEEGLKAEKLVDYVYEGLGGAIAEGAEGAKRAEGRKKSQKKNAKKDS